MSFDPGHLAALAAILRGGSFESAAAQLGVTPSAISQRIKALEETVGTALINRGQPCTGTQTGIKLARHAEDIALLEAHTLREITPDRDTAPPRIRIAVNADSLATWFMSALAKVPDTLFDLVIDDQDHSTDWLRRGAVSAAVTGRENAVAGCDVQHLGQFRYIATASPAFMDRWFPDGVSVEGFAQAPMMAFNNKDALQHRWITEHTGKDVEPPTHHMASTHAFVDAALSGLGWGMNPEPLVRAHLDAGRLVPLISDAPLDISLFWQTSRLMMRALAPLSRSVNRSAADSLRH